MKSCCCLLAVLAASLFAPAAPLFAQTQPAAAPTDSLIGPGTMYARDASQPSQAGMLRTEGCGRNQARAESRRNYYRTFRHHNRYLGAQLPFNRLLKNSAFQAN
jgi:hypothetical protein